VRRELLHPGELVPLPHHLDLVDALEAHAPHAADPDYFYALRGLELAGLDPVRRAARLVFLNRTCFNGLYRVNRAGRFNVPFGRYKNPRVLHADQLRASSRALQGVRLVVGDFTATLRAARRGGAAYLDPPYVPRSATSTFTAYAQDRFTDDDHRRLLEAFLRLQRRGVPVLLSNSDCRFTRALYRGLRVKAVRAGRSINAVAARRGPVSELLVHGAPTR
jgi:DNA adenine methylase